MKRLTLIFFCSIGWALFAPSADAQQDAQFGLGVGLSSSGFGVGGVDIVESALSPTSIYVPITFSTFRIEPEIGIFRTSSEDGSVETSSTAFQIGTGVFILNPVGRTNIYYGGRLGITRLSSSFESPAGESESSRTNVFLGPAAGGEFLFSDNFSLGGEGQLLFTSIGEDDDDDESASLLRTRAVFFVRWYP